MNEVNEQTLLIEALADGELSGAEKQRALALIQSDPIFALEHTRAESTKRCLSNLPPLQYEQDVWNACKRRLNEIDRTKRTEAFVGKYAWGLCGIFLMLIIGGKVMNKMGFQSHLGTGDVSAMASNLAMFGGQQQIAPQSTQILPALPAAMRRPMVIASAQGEFNGMIIKKFLLQDGFGKMMLLDLPTTEPIDGLHTSSDDPNVSEGQIADNNCVALCENGRTLVLIAHRPTESLHQLLVGR